MGQKTGTAAILSIIAAIGSYFLTFSAHYVWGLLIAILSVIFGIVGVMMAASPRVSGGIISIIAIVLGGIGVLVAILAMVGAILF
jgi:hypothetical protein